jgi:peptide deformylase
LAVKEILEIPHPLLRQRARKVRRIDKRMLQLAYDMVDTMREAGGVGLAANQVGELRRLIVIQVPEEEEARIYFNPEILAREGTREVEEGCLSYPGYRAIIERSMWVRFGALDHTEKEIKVKADGLLAQAMEHEVDHLNGILYLDHLSDHTKLYKVDEQGEPVDEEAVDPEGDTTPVDEIPQPEDAPASLKVT